MAARGSLFRFSEKCRNIMDKSTKGRSRNGLLTTNKG